MITPHHMAWFICGHTKVFPAQQTQPCQRSGVLFLEKDKTNNTDNKFFKAFNFSISAATGLVCRAL